MEFKIGNIVDVAEIVKTDSYRVKYVARLKGVILQILPNGRMCIKVLENNGIDKSRLGGAWSRYGLKSKEYIYIHPKYSNKYRLSVVPHLSQYSTVNELKIRRQTHLTITKDNDLVTAKNKLSTVNSSLLVIKVNYPGCSPFTYVLNKNKGRGAYAEGLSDNSVNLAIARLNCYVYERKVQAEKVNLCTAYDYNLPSCPNVDPYYTNEWELAHGY